tara:strand:+ start:507 stop:1520 length:1014 start_codon:yes stop_codon:yes gene_type:complete
MSLGKKLINISGAAPVPVGTDNFNTVLYTGNGSTQSITGVGFQPDFVWVKERSAIGQHSLFDSVRGATKRLDSSSANAESTASSSLTSFNSDGFTFGAESGNNNGVTAVAWNWYAPTSETNTSGTITSTIKKNVDAGFSIASYTGNGTQNATIGHGLTSPSLLLVKNLSQADSWFVGSTLLAANNSMELNSTAAAGTAADFHYEITSTAFKTTSSTPAHMINASGENYIMYTFADVAGYQKVGSYTGTGNASNTVDVGFTPSWLMTKRSNSTGPWMIFDNKRNPSNPRNTRLGADLTAGDASFSIFNIDFDSTSFTLNGTDPDINGGSDTYIYLAIA